ncbi:MAG TPA: hypothetical protein VJI67_02065, partial [archaeon]|nr:hypothetical protein [archaeon]
MKNSSLSLLFSILLLAGCSAPPAQPYAGSEPLMFSLTASDGVELKADFYNSGKVLSPALLLVHMLGSDRTAWKDFSIQAKAQGFTVLAIDLRG